MRRGDGDLEGSRSGGDGSAFRRLAGATGGEVSIIRPPATADLQDSRQSVHLPRPFTISSSKDRNNTQQRLGLQESGPEGSSAVNFVARLKERSNCPTAPEGPSAWSDSDPGGD